MALIRMYKESPDLLESDFMKNEFDFKDPEYLSKMAEADRQSNKWIRKIRHQNARSTEAVCNVIIGRNVHQRG